MGIDSRWFPEVFNDSDHRQMAIDVFLRLGTNLILDNEVDESQSILQAIVLLECYFDDAEKGCRARGLKYLHSNERDKLKFYSKRISCSCLRQNHKLARMTLPKLGACVQCQQFFERAHLMTCGCCNFPHYCSRECQVAAWPKHEHECGVYANIRERQEKHK